MERELTPLPPSLSLFARARGSVADEKDCEVAGDNDPVDVVEIGSTQLEMGGVYEVKVLGVYAMIDDGELDWKVIAVNAADEHADAMNDVGDIEKASAPCPCPCPCPYLWQQ